MTKRKTFKELTIKDNFMFGAVMCDEENCRRLLELVLEFPIARVEVSKEKCIVYHPEYKGIRLDVYAKDEKNTHYNVEMQAVKEKNLGKRSRYYHSQIDMELLSAGAEYHNLPATYVIFICDFDPFGQKKYRYTFKSTCSESPISFLEDQRETIFLNTNGQNSEDVPNELVKFLKYVKADLASSTKDFNDSFVAQLQKSVSSIKTSRRMEERYMLTELLMQDQRRTGRHETILEQLSEIGTVSDDLREKITSEYSKDKLKKWTKLILQVDSIEEFISKMEE